VGGRSKAGTDLRSFPVLIAGFLVVRIFCEGASDSVRALANRGNRKLNMKKIEIIKMESRPASNGKW
jgi:hypothetical protein